MLQNKQKPQEFHRKPGTFSIAATEPPFLRLLVVLQLLQTNNQQKK